MKENIKRQMLKEYCIENGRLELLSQWHPVKNGDQTPANVPAGSNRKFWWMDEMGHEWEQSLYNRCVRRSGCPICAGRVVLPGFNDLASKNPELSAQWHPTKNGTLTPQMFRPGSSQKVWWHCEKGHEWQATIASRSSGTGCPVCANRRVVPGENDFASTHPEIAVQWHPTRNGTLTPQKISHGYDRKVWWVCSKGHEWRASPTTRVKMGSECPICSNYLVLTGYNDLATTHPSIAGQWHPTKNGSLTPQEIVAGSNRSVWWQCSLGHEWCAKVVDRTRGTSGCPYCANQKVLKGFNDLATTHPKVAAQWHPTLIEIGKYETTSLEAGDTVRIPLNLVGMKEGQYCGGFSANITLGTGLEWFETNAACVEWTSLMSSFGSKFINHSTGLLTAVDYSAASNGTTSCNQDGKVCDILCRVTEAYDGTNATIALSGVSISGTTAAVFLNSSDGTRNSVDNSAILFNGEKVAEGSPISAVIVPEYSIVAEADKAEVVAGEDVTVTVTVKGGKYVGAAVKLTYDSDKFELKSAPTTGWDAAGASVTYDYGYYNVNQSGGTFAKDTIIGTFVFTAKALSAEADTVVSLAQSYVAQSFDDGWSTDPANAVPNTDASVTIKQDALAGVSVPAMDAITYDGEEHAFEAVTSATEGVTITYSETEDGTYASAIPSKKNAGTYTLYYKVEKLGYTTVTGSYTMTIDPCDVTIIVPDQGKTFGQNDPNLTYTVNNKVEGDTFDATIIRAEGEDVGDYAITVTPGVNPNYNVTSNPGGTFTISAATIEGYTVDWANITGYDGQEHAVATMITAEDAIAGVTITWKVNDGNGTTDIPSIKDAGDYTVTYTISKEGYTSITDTKTFNVAKAQVTITADNKTMTYGESVPNLTYQVTSGTIYGNDNLSIQLSTTATNTSNVGDYDITVSYDTANTNYEVTTVKGKLTIDKATITGYSITGKDDVNYDEQAHVSATVVTGTPADATITYTWTENGEEQTSTTVPSFTNGGTYTVSYTISKANYTDVTGSYTFTINSGVVEASADDVNVTYDGQPHSITVNVTKPQGATISYRTSEDDGWSTENPTFTNVTSTPATVYWKVSKDGYTDKTGSATVTITAKAVTITPNAVSKTYGESDPTLTGTVTGLVNANDLGTVTYTRETGENVKVGGYTITANYTANANYTVMANTAVFTINPKAVTITLDDKSITLGDSQPEYTGEVAGLLQEGDLGNITYACPTYKQEVGTYAITASYTENDNYTVTVNPGTLTIGAPTYQVEFINEYVTGYHMILVYTDDASTFSYDGKAMYDVSSAGYKYGESETGYNHVYAIVVAGVEGDTEDTLKAKVAADMTAVAGVLDCTTLDVNGSSSVDLRDAVAVVAVYNANEIYMTSYLPIVLKADVDHSKGVDAEDFGLIKAEYMK